MAKAHLIPTSKSAPVMLPSQAKCLLEQICLVQKGPQWSHNTDSLALLQVLHGISRVGGKTCLLCSAEVILRPNGDVKTHSNAVRARDFLPEPPPGTFLPTNSKTMAELADTHHHSKPTPHTKHIWHGKLKKPHLNKWCCELQWASEPHSVAFCLWHTKRGGIGLQGLAIRK